MKNNISAVLFALAIVISSALLSHGFINRNKAQESIAVTGLGKKSFTSDLIVWEGTFTKNSANLIEGFKALKKDKDIIIVYLKEKGINTSDVVFKAVSTEKNFKSNYNSEGKFIGKELVGYTLSQQLQIDSKEVEKVEKLSREITELLNKGVYFYSESPRYYYTQLEDLKIEMISKATENARLRAEKIAENSGAKLGQLISGKMGIFQITGENSNENYSWGGAFNTSSKNKTASITMKLIYQSK